MLRCRSDPTNPMTMTRIEARTLLLRTMGNRSVREMATDIKVTPGYLYDVLKGRRDLGPSILTFLGLEKQTVTTITYTFKKGKR